MRLDHLLSRENGSAGESKGESKDELKQRTSEQRDQHPRSIPGASESCSGVKKSDEAAQGANTL